MEHLIILGGYSYGDDEKIDLIAKKLWSFREYSSISLEDLEGKLNDILSKLDDIGQ